MGLFGLICGLWGIFLGTMEYVTERMWAMKNKMTLFDLKRQLERMREQGADDHTPIELWVESMNERILVGDLEEARIRNGNFRRVQLMGS